MTMTDVARMRGQHLVNKLLADKPR